MPDTYAQRRHCQHAICTTLRRASVSVSEHEALKNTNKLKQAIAKAGTYPRIFLANWSRVCNRLLVRDRLLLCSIIHGAVLLLLGLEPLLRVGQRPGC